MPVSSENELKAQLADSAWRIGVSVKQLQTLVESLALDSVVRLRKELARAIRDLRLANKDRKLLRKELIQLHELLNEQVDGMKPRLTGNQTGTKLR